MTKEVLYKDLGLIDYKEAWDYQTDLFQGLVDGKLNARKNNEDFQSSNYLLFCEHPHVYTLGKSGDKSNLLIDENKLKEVKASFYKINRGGDITYHGPGQLVGYPIFDLDNFFTDIHKYLRFLEEAIILTLKEFGIIAGRVDGLTGVWVAHESPMPRKICAMGVKCSRWVTMHGFALNINPQIKYFNNIVPCGIDDKAVTSMKLELGIDVDPSTVKEKLLLNLANIFDFEIKQ